MPLSDDKGILLVDEKYVQFVVSLANSKLELNGEKIKKLEKCCEVAKFWPPSGDNENDASEVPKVGKKQKSSKFCK